MEFIASNLEFGITEDGRATVKMTLPAGFLPDSMSLTGATMQVSMEPLSKARTKSQNAYMWSLIAQLAEKLRSTKEEVYREFVRNYGVSDFISISSAAAQSFMDMWSRKGIGWESELISDNGKMADIAVYYGSSAYDSKEMSRLLEAVINECNGQGIATYTLEEAMKLNGN